MSHFRAKECVNHTKYKQEADESFNPLRLYAQIKLYSNKDFDYSIPLYICSVQAGFPSPADNYIESFLNLNSLSYQASCRYFFVKASGDSMKGAGINSGDLFIVDRSLEATHGKIVIAALNGELAVKRLSKIQGKVRLLSENSRYKPIDIAEEEELGFGGVTYIIHAAG